MDIRIFVDEDGHKYEVPENEMGDFTKNLETSGKKIEEVNKQPAKILNFKDETGVSYDVPESEIDEFMKSAKNKGVNVQEIKKAPEKIRTFEDEYGRTYDVPENEIEEFKKSSEGKGIKFTEIQKQMRSFKDKEGNSYEVPQEQMSEFIETIKASGKEVQEVKDLGWWGTVRKRKEAEFGKLTTGEFLYSLIPGLGDAEQIRQEKNERALFNGEFNDTLEGGKIAAAAGIPQEEINKIYEETGSGGRNRFGGWNQHDMVEFKKRMKALAEPLLKKRIITREAARKDLENNDINFVEKAAAGLVGITDLAPMANTAAAVATMPGAAVVRGAELSMPELTVDENDKIIEVAKGDEDGVALAKGAAGATVERVVWLGLKRILGAGGSYLLKKFPVIDKALGFVAGKANKWSSKAMEEISKTEAGKILLKTGEIVGKFENKAHLGSLPEMVVKSRLTEFSDEVAGLNVADSQDKEEFSKWRDKFLSVEDNVEMLIDMIGIHAVMGGIAAVKNKKAERSFRENASEIIGQYLSKERMKELSNEDISMLARMMTSKELTAEKSKEYIEKIKEELSEAEKRVANGETYTDLKKDLEIKKTYSEKGIETAEEIAKKLEEEEQREVEESNKKRQEEQQKVEEEAKAKEEEKQAEESIEEELRNLKEANEQISNDREATEEVSREELVENAFDRKEERTQEKQIDRKEEEIGEKEEDIAGKERIAEEVTGDKANATTPVEREDGTFGDLPKVANEISESKPAKKRIEDVKEPRTINESISTGPDMESFRIEEGRSGELRVKGMPEVRGKIENGEIVIENLKIEDFTEENRLRKTIAYIINAKKLADDRGFKIVFTGENASEIKDLATAAFHQIAKRGFSMVNAFSEMRRMSALEWLAKSGLGNGFVVDAEKFEAAILEDKNGKMLSSGFRPWGYLSSEGTIYINPVYFETDIPVHEYGHLAQEALRKINPTLLEHGYRLLEGSEVGRLALEEVSSMPEYQFLDGEGLKEEALNVLIEKAGKGMLERGAESMNKWVDALWKDLGAEWGLGDLTTEQISRLSIGEVADAIAAEMLQGGIKNRTFGDVKKNWGEKKVTGAESKPFQKDFPDVVVHTTRETTKKSTRLTKLFDKAKAGDMAAAVTYIKNLYSASAAKGVGYRHPKAWIVPVIAENPEGRNRIPLALATVVSKISGLKLSNDIVQTSTGKRRGAALIEHITMPITFAGRVKKGQEYVIIDDHNTSGTTFQALRTFIEANGGKVVECMALTQGSRGLPSGHNFGRLNVDPKKVAEIRNKYEGYNIDEALRRKGLAGNCESLTGTQAEIILRTDRQKVIKSLGLDERSEGTSEEVRTGNEHGDGSGLRAVSPEEAAAVIATPELRIESVETEKAAERIGKYAFEGEFGEEFAAREKESEKRREMREASEFESENKSGEIEKRVEAGDPKAFNLLVLKNQDRVVKWAKWKVAKGHLPEAVIEEIVQEMWVEAAGKYINAAQRPDYSIWTFIRRSIKWRVLDEFKRKKHIGKEALTLNTTFGNGEEQTSERIDFVTDKGVMAGTGKTRASEEQRIEEQQQARDRISEILSYYPERMQRLFRMKGVENRTFEEIGKALNITTSNAHMIYESMMREIRNGSYKRRTPAATQDIGVGENLLTRKESLGPEASTDSIDVESGENVHGMSGMSEIRHSLRTDGNERRSVRLLKYVVRSLEKGMTIKELAEVLKNDTTVKEFGYSGEEESKIETNIKKFLYRNGVKINVRRDNKSVKAAEKIRGMIEEGYSKKEMAEWFANAEEAEEFGRTKKTLESTVEWLNSIFKRQGIAEKPARGDRNTATVIRRMSEEGKNLREIANWFVESEYAKEFGKNGQDPKTVEDWLRKLSSRNGIKIEGVAGAKRKKEIEEIRELARNGFTMKEIGRKLFGEKGEEGAYQLVRKLCSSEGIKTKKEGFDRLEELDQRIYELKNSGYSIRRIAEELEIGKGVVEVSLKRLQSKGKFAIGEKGDFEARKVEEAENVFFQRDGFYERYGSIPKEIGKAARIVIESRGISGLTFNEGEEVPESIRMKGPGWAINHRTKTVKEQLRRIYEDLPKLCSDNQLKRRMEQKGFWGFLMKSPVGFERVEFRKFARQRRLPISKEWYKRGLRTYTYFLDKENHACNEARVAWGIIIKNEDAYTRSGKRVFTEAQVKRALELFTPEKLIELMARKAVESGAKAIYKPANWQTIADKWLAEKVAGIAFEGRMTETGGFGAWFWNQKEANEAIVNSSLFAVEGRPRNLLGEGVYFEDGRFVLKEGAAKNWIEREIKRTTGAEIDAKEMEGIQGYQECLKLYARGGRDITAYNETNKLVEEIRALTENADNARLMEVNSKQEEIHGEENRNNEGDPRTVREGNEGTGGFSTASREGSVDEGRTDSTERDRSSGTGDVRNEQRAVGSFSIDPLGDVFEARPDKHIADAESEWNNGGISYAVEQSESMRPWTRPGSPAASDKPIAFDSADLVRFYRNISKIVRPPKVYGKSPEELNGIQIAAKIFGVIDKSDVNFVKDSLKEQGYFRYEDPAELENMSAGELYEDSKKSWKALDEELKKLYEHKVRTAEGGNHEPTMVLARELGQILLQLPTNAATGKVAGNARKLLNALVARTKKDLGIADDMRKAVAWWHGQEECPEYYKGDKLAAEVFGILLTQPEKLADVAPKAYKAMVKTIAENENLSKAYREFCAAKWNGKADDILIEELEKTWDEKMARRIKELESKAENPNWKWVDDFNYALNDRFGPMFSLPERGFAEKKKRWEKLEKEGRITPTMRIELEQQAEKIILSLKSRLYDYQRAIGGEIRMMVYGFNEVIEKAKESGVNWYAVRRYAHLMRIIELGGRATAHAITPMRAAKLLERMKEKLGSSEFAKVESTAKEFRAVYEREIIENPEVQGMFDGRTNAMLKRNKHYVTMKHTMTAEEVEQYEKEIAEYKKDSDTRDPTIDLWIRLHKGLEVDNTGKTGYKLSPLVGSFDATKDPIAETMKKAIEIRMAAKRNTLIKDLGKVLQMANVRDVYTNAKKMVFNQRLGTLVYMENGRTQRLIVPRIIEKCFNTEGSLSVLPGIQETMRALRHTMTIWNPSFINRAYMIDKSSLETNVKGLHKAPVDVIAEALMMKIPFTNVHVGVPLYAVNNYIARFTDFTNTWIGKLLYGPNTVNHYARQAQKIASIVYEAKFGEMIKKAKELREEGRTSEAAEIEENVMIAKEMLQHNVFQSQYEFNAVQKATSSTEIMNAFNIGKEEQKEIERIEKAKQKAKEAGRAWNRYGEEQEAVSKIITWLYDSRIHPDGEMAARARLAIEQGGTPNLNARGILASWIENATGFFWNVRKEGMLRSWRALKDHPTEWATKATVQTLLPQFIKGLAITGTLTAIVKKILFDDDEEKMNQSSLAPIIQFYEWMGKAMRNVPSYEQRNYNVIPLAMNEEGTGTIGLRIKWSPEEFAVANAVHAYVQSIAEKPTDPSADPSTTLSGMILELLPNFEGVNPVSSWTWALLAPWMGINPYDSFRQRNLYTDDAMLARWREPKYIGKEMMVNSVNYSPIGSLVKVIDNERDVAEDAKAPDGINVLLNGMPVLSRIARSCIGYWSAPEKSGAVAGLVTLDKEKRAVIKLQAGEVLAKMMERDQLSNLGEEIKNVCGEIENEKKSAITRLVISGWRTYCRNRHSSQQYRLLKETKKIKDPGIKAKGYQYIRDAIEQED